MKYCLHRGTWCRTSPEGWFLLLLLCFLNRSHFFPPLSGNLRWEAFVEKQLCQHELKWPRNPLTVHLRHCRALASSASAVPVDDLCVCVAHVCVRISCTSVCVHVSRLHHLAQ